MGELGFVHLGQWGSGMPDWRDVVERDQLRLAGGLLVGGFLVLAIVTQFFHPSGDEDNHPVIFAEYARSDSWIAVHFLQTAGVLIALGGLVLLYHALELRGELQVLARCALVTTIAAAAIYAALQAVDGITLKQAVDAWYNASGAEQDDRFADAETVRWIEWALQSYFRLLLGLALVLFGVAIGLTGIVFRWLGWVAALAGILYVATGIAVGYEGLDTPGDP